MEFSFSFIYSDIASQTKFKYVDPGKTEPSEALIPMAYSDNQFFASLADN